MMKTIYSPVLLLILLSSTWTHAQKYFEKKPVVSTSPQATAIEKFTDYPVSLFTGVPGIDIPVYEVKLKGVTLPISLSYHAGGNKVDDVASNVGLGWSLNAGGAISIQANGILDEFSQFGYQHPMYNKVKNLTLLSSYPAFSLPCATIQAAEDPIYLYGGGGGLFAGLAFWNGRL